MAPRTVYANLQDGLQFLSLWDQSLADMGLLGTIPCVASGTNAVVLTPVTAVFPPNVTAYQGNIQFSFVPVATSTGAVTARVGALSVLTVYRNDGTQAGAGDLVQNQVALIAYNSTLGGFQLVNQSKQAAGGSGLVQVTGASATITAGTPAVAIVRTAPVTTSLTLPAVSAQADKLQIFDWSSSVTGHTITINRAGSDMIMRATSFQLFSNAASLASITLYPSTTLGGWYTA